MAYVHIPGMKRYRCWICGAPSDQRHHAAYPPWRQDLDERFALLPLCEEHHADLHRLHEHLGRKVSLALFTLWYVHNPVLAVQQVQAIQPGQLDFGQQNTPQGEYWQQWEALFLEFEPEWRQDEAA